MKVYLGGPINGCTDEEAHGWREATKPTIEEHGHEWVDPMTRDYRGRELEPGIAAEIVNGDKIDIDGCDLLLMNAPKPSYGTAMEILYGWQRGKRVIVVLPEGATPSPWVLHHSEAVYYGSVENAAREVLSRDA